MITLVRICLPALALAIGTARAIAVPQDSGDNDVQRELDKMRQELGRVMADNQAMRGEIDQLRAEADDQWLTEQRANEIKGLVADVLADADTRASMLQSGLTAGWDEHFFLSSPDNRFLLIFEGLEQIRFIWNYHNEPDRWRYGFENARTQLTFRGHVFTDAIEYLIRGEFARSGGNQGLLDAWMRYRFNDKLSLRFGQFKLPFNREFLVGDGEGLTVERSIVSELFSVKRSQGIELEYIDSVNRVDVAFSDGSSSSIAGTNTVNTVWSAQDTDWALTGRYERLIAGTWDQFDDFTSRPDDEFGMLIGAAVHAQQGESTGSFTGSRDETRFIDATADLSVEWGGANAFVAAHYGYLDTAQNTASGGGIFDIYGVVAQAGLYLSAKWEVFGRFEWIAFRSNVPALDDFGAVTFGANYYMDGHDLKWTTDISFGLDKVSFGPDITGFRTDAADDSNPQVVIRTQFQVMF